MLPNQSLHQAKSTEFSLKFSLSIQYLDEIFLLYILYLDEREAKAGAEALAARMPMTAYGLYMLSKETLVGTLGSEGEVVYCIFQDGRYGYVSQ